jgi:type IV secretory pathway TraG/TraD family ATPase VirD4
MMFGLATVLPLVGAGYGWRVNLFDPKGEYVPLARAMVAPGTVVHITNPLDATSSAWDVAKDIVDVSGAWQLMNALIPDASDSSNVFFTKSSRRLGVGVLVGFQLKLPGEWTFRDLILATRTEERIRSVMEHVPDGMAVCDQVFANPKTGAEVLSTLTCHLAEFEPIAAAWHRSYEQGRTFSITGFCDREEVLFDPFSDSSSAVLKPIARLLKQRLAEELLQRNNPEPTTLIVAEECRSIAYVPGLVQLAQRGRTAGVIQWISLQSQPALAGAWSVALAEEYLENFQTLLSCKVNHKTAQWISERIGQSHGWEVQRNTSAQMKESLGQPFHYKRLPLVEPEHLLRLSVPVFNHGCVRAYVDSVVTGLFLSDDIPIAKTNQLLGVKEDSRPAFTPRPATDQVLKALDPNGKVEKLFKLT